MTLVEAKAKVKSYGMVLRYSVDWQEYRVNFIGGKEETAYYTNDRFDAVMTAMSMASMNDRNEYQQHD